MSADDDDLLNLDEIEDLLRSAEAEVQEAARGSQAPPAGGDPRSGGGPAGGEPPLAPEDIDALLKQQAAGRPAATAARLPPAPAPLAPAASGRNPDDLLQQVEADLASVLANDGSRRGTPSELGPALPFEFPAFDSQTGERGGVGLEALEDVELDLRIELGRTELLIEEVLQLKEGSVVPLDKLAGDPVDILVNGRLVARGEVLVLNDNFCVRVAEILAPDF